MIYSGEKMWEDPDARSKLRGNIIDHNEYERADIMARKIMDEM